MPHRLLALVLLLAASLPAAAQERVALVVGNAAYRNAPELANPVNDARAVAAKLRAMGFEVFERTDLSHTDFNASLGAFSEAALRAEVALIFYAGHGIEIGGENYLIPVDARMRSEIRAPFETISLRDMLGTVQLAGTLGMVLVDACRDNPFVATMLGRDGRTRAVRTRGLAPVTIAPDSALIVGFAAQSGRTADDGDGPHSPYTSALLEVLDEPGLEVGRMLRKVRARVADATGNRQIPIERSQLPAEDVYLVPPEPTRPDPGETRQEARPAPPDPAPRDATLAYLEAIESGTEADLKRFLAEFPDDPRADQVRDILVDQADDEVWASTRARDTVRAYRIYLGAFPEGRHRAAAGRRIDELEEIARLARVQREPEPEPAPAPAGAELFRDIDFKGGDLTSGGIRNVSLARCEEICRETPRCAAFSYVRAKRWCWPKANTGTRTAERGITSGLLPGVAQTATAARGYERRHGVDFKGNDLTSGGIRNVSLATCEARCTAMAGCRAYTYVTAKRWCWPKTGVGATASDGRMISGVAR